MNLSLKKQIWLWSGFAFAACVAGVLFLHSQPKNDVVRCQLGHHIFNIPSSYFSYSHAGVAGCDTAANEVYFTALFPDLLTPPRAQDGEHLSDILNRSLDISIKVADAEAGKEFSALFPFMQKHWKEEKGPYHLIQYISSSSPAADAIYAGQSSDGVWHSFFLNDRDPAVRARSKVLPDAEIKYNLTREQLPRWSTIASQVDSLILQFHTLH